jgi:general secretion pathway protein K
MKGHAHLKQHEHGAAVVMALLIVVLCTLAVSPLIWNLFATAKTISVAAARNQASQVSQSAVDWARVILREDARISTTDTLNEPWAVPLAESRLSESLMRKEETTSNLDDREAVVTGHIEDAQGRFNLRNLGADNPKKQTWQKAFARLCELLEINSGQQQGIIQTMAQMYPAPKTQQDDSQTSTSSTPLIPALRWEEFKNRFDLTPETWTQLQPYVALLPTITPINANTASAEVLYAGLSGSNFSDAQSLVSRRERTTFRDLADIQALLQPNQHANNDLIGVQSNYFLVEGTAQVDEALIRTHAMLERKNQRVYVMWSTN